MAAINDDIRFKKAWEPYKSKWHYIKVPQKTVLLKEGEIANKFYRIVKGAVRVWFNHDGKEISFQFFFEGDVVCSVESFKKGVPSSFYIETIEPSIIRWIGKADLNIIVEENDFLNKYMMDWVVEKQSEFIRHFFSFLRDTPQRRYENLLAQKPHIIKRVPLQHIASYLGITPVSLSRIRNKI